MSLATGTIRYRVLVGLVFTIIAALIRTAEYPWAGPGYPYAAFYPFVFLAALAGGFVAALIVIVCAILLSVSYPPFIANGLGYFLTVTIIFAASSLIVGWMGEVILRLKFRLERANAELTRTVEDLKSALADSQLLRGLLPICSVCKRIRDDQGYWKQLENYITAHSQAKFSHGLCPECARRSLAMIDLPDSSDFRNEDPR